MALNKENKRRSAGFPFWTSLPKPDLTISNADRRAIAGVYWGFLDTNYSLGNTGAYTNAKTIFNGETRSFLSLLPRNMLWTLTGGFTDVNERKAVLDTRFWAIPCNSANQLLDLIGTLKLHEYISANPTVPITLRTHNNSIVYEDAAPPSSVYACWQSSGIHIGSVTACTNPDLSPGKYRFYKSDGTPELQTYLDADGKYFRIPIYPPTGYDESGVLIGTGRESISLWELCEDRHWDTYPGTGKALVDALSGYGINVATHPGGAGIILDYEDFLDDALPDTDTNNPTTRSLFEADPRMATASPTTEMGQLYRQYVGAMLDARAAKVLQKAAWIQELYANLYDYDWVQAGSFTTRFSTAYNRNRINLRFYAWGDNDTNDVTVELFRYGNRAYQSAGKLPASAQLADLWFSTSEQSPGVLDPVGNFLNIVHSVMSIKCALALGAVRILFYRGASDPAHPYFSALVAYEEMQQYAETIKNGTNFIPPAANNKYQTNAYDVTAFYRKDSNGAEIDANTYIACRYWGERMLFFGGTTDGTSRTVGVKAPTGDTAYVFAAPYGDITVINPPTTGLKKIPLAHFVDRSDRLKPKGLLTSAGLTSAMRNPMVEGPYRDYLLVDFRPRDNWTVSATRENVRQSEFRLIKATGTADYGKLACDDEGAYVEEFDPLPSGVGGICSLQLNDDPGSSLLSLDKDSQNRDKIAVMLAAIKVKSLTLTDPSNVSVLQASTFGYFSGGGGRLIAQLMRNELIGGQPKFQAVLYNRANADANHNFPSGTTGEILATSTEKWVLLQLVKQADNTAVMRALGGQFGIGAPLELAKAAQPTEPVPPWTTDAFRLGARRQNRLGFATLAHYVNNAGVPGTGASEISWLLFDAEHRCKEYIISGTRILFTCLNQVSWEIFSQSAGDWRKQIEPNGAWVSLDTIGTRRFYSGGATLDTEQFSLIRPVLRNTGDLNSDTLAVLTSVSAGFP